MISLVMTVYNLFLEMAFFIYGSLEARLHTSIVQKYISSRNIPQNNGTDKNHNN